MAPEDCKYDWVAIRAFYEQGHSAAECRRKFGFAKRTWENAVERGYVRPIHRPTSAELAEKKCPRCERMLPIDSFHRRGHRRHSFCKDCQALVRSASYYKSREYYVRKVHERQRDVAKWLEEYKSTLSCARCGFSHPAVIHFHHRDPGQKTLELGRAVKAGWGKKRILQELEKCEPLCANCHFIHHWEERRGMHATGESVQEPARPGGKRQQP